MPKGVKRKPWETEGVSKSTWFRHKRNGKKPAGPIVKARRARADVVADSRLQRYPDPIDEIEDATLVDMVHARTYGDDALVAEFLTITAPQFCGTDHIYHRISPAMVDALRRRVGGG